ncbi:glycosyltransferase [Riemerella columbina]|uniref:glycosyltransferase n=1 Tax=Riemerella columbina TaxID=103810 RepID=UPI00266F6125|nr:glycosyltransferase [Riemerella columbina]WKS94551.1 glycosyltransferase [Riemerella columbina]
MPKPKNILIISYYWPPAGGPGVQRWLKFVKYLPDFGWTPTVYTPENPSYPLIDETLNAEASPQTKIIKTKIWEPYAIAEKLNRQNKKFKSGQFDVGKNQSWKSKLSIWIRGNFFIPDARVFWVKPSVKFLKRYLEQNPTEVLVTTGPPHSMHLIGLRLKKIFPNLRWVADFRDPWTEISYYQHLKLTPFADRKHRHLEQEVFQNADLVLATSYTDAAHFKAQGANAFCITNGFDKETENSSETLEHQGFVMSYIGVLEQLRNPKVLWTVLNEILKEEPSFSQDFKLKLVGKIDPQIIQEWQGTPLQSKIEILGYLSHNDAVTEMKNADVLLITNFPNPQSQGIIPGKLFEYLASGQPILSFGPPSADVKKILHETHTGKHFTYAEASKVKSYILQIYQQWKSQSMPTQQRQIQQFSRKNLTKQLVDLLEKIN